MTKRERVAILAVVLIGGAVLMALEVAAFRIVGKTFGTALRETTAVIAVFLTAMSIGYLFGGRAVDRAPRVSTLAWTFILSSPLMLVSLEWDELVASWIGSSALPSATHAFAATTILFAAPTVLLASIGPIAVRLLATDTDRSGRVAGMVSALSTAGSIAGTVLTAFVLLDAVGSIRRTVLLLAAITFLLAIVLGLASMRRNLASWPRGAVAAGAVVAILLLGGAYGTRPGARTSASDVIFERATAYHQIRVIERQKPRRVRELYFGSTLQSRHFVGDPDLRGLEYEEYKHFAKIARPAIKDVLMIGFGGGTSARQFTAFYPDVRVDAVDVDGVVFDVARRFFDVTPSDRLRLFAGDGRTFVRRSSKRYDLISIDVYTHGRYGSTIPSHLVTRQFFREVSGRLNDDGIVHLHSYMARDSELTRSLYKTMRSVFPSVVMLGETELFASATPIFADEAFLRAQASAIRERLPEIDERLSTVSVEPPKTDDVPLLTDDHAPVDSMLRRDRARR